MRFLFSVDCWAHYLFPPRVHRRLFGRMCDWLDRRMVESDNL